MSAVVLHRVDADLAEHVHVLGVVDDRDDVRHFQFLCQQTDHDVRRVLIGRRYERIGTVRTGVL